MCKKEKNEKINRRAARNIFTEFITGYLSIYEFYTIYSQSERLRRFLISNKKPIKMPNGSGGYMYVHIDETRFAINPNNLLTKFDINNFEHRHQLFLMINRYLLARNINIDEKDYNKDEKLYLILQNLLPSWLDVVDMNFIKNIYESAPNDLNFKQKNKWCKAKILELFKYENQPPVWIQWAEWPIVNEIPLVFIKQEKSKDGAEKYHFTNIISGDELIVEQIE